MFTVFILSVFQELLQNADDAGSSTVEIHFETIVDQRRPGEENARPSTVSDLKLTDVKVPTDSFPFVPFLTLWGFLQQGRTVDSQKQRKTIQQERLGAIA